MHDEELPNPLAAGQVLEGKYQVARLLGGGAMGVVYEGYHLLLQKSVAIKVLRPELAAVEDVRDRFEAEARAAAAIGHPNIVAVTDMGRTPEGAMYFVMDRLRGETLGERIQRARRLDLRATLAIAADVLSGLEAAHAMRLVHRDLKPDNIFLTRPPGGGEIAKILDFGIAKALASVGRRSNATRVGLTVGTPMYMAPEQAIAAPDIDQRADIYSMGVILYEMLSGRRPFEGTDALQVLAAVMTATPEPLAGLCPEASPALVRVVESAMARDKTQRPGTAAELLTRLREAASETPAARQPASTALDAGGYSALGPQDVRGRAPAVPGDPLASPVLTDLRGDEPDQGRLDRLYPALAAPSWAEPPAPPAPDPELKLATEVIDRGSAPDAEAAPAPAPRSRRALMIAVPLAAVALAAVVALPRLRASPAPAAGPPMGLVRIAGTPPNSRIYVDGVQVSSNPTQVALGMAHTFQSEADGYTPGYKKTAVADGDTVMLTMHRKK